LKIQELFKNAEKDKTQYALHTPHFERSQKIQFMAATACLSCEEKAGAPKGADAPAGGGLYRVTEYVIVKDLKNGKYPQGCSWNRKPEGNGAVNTAFQFWQKCRSGFSPEGLTYDHAR
jgi:hypothetical protein